VKGERSVAEKSCNAEIVRAGIKFHLRYLENAFIYLTRWLNILRQP
jgi:hypothetical protein